MADAPTPKGTRLIDFAPPEVTDKLIKLQVGGCTCMTKSPELRFHDAWCTYRLAVEVQDLLNTAPTPSPPVAAPPATPEWDGKLPEALQRKINALRLECAPAIVSDVEHEVRSVFEGMHTSLATVKRMYAAARDRLEAAEPQVDPFAQPQPQTAQPLTGASQDAVVQALKDAIGVISSINGGHANKVMKNGEAVYWQRKEWIDWARLEVMPTIEAALAIITAPSTPTPPEVVP